MSEAIKYLQMYIEAEDSLKIANEQMASSEFATLLEVCLLYTSLPLLRVHHVPEGCERLSLTQRYPI